MWPTAYSAYVPLPNYTLAATLSLTFKWTGVPGPNYTITPLPSHPGVQGKGNFAYSPFMNNTSDGLIGAASTLNKNSPF